MDHYVYVLKSLSHGTRYVGTALDVQARITEHNNGRCRYTSGRKPWKLVYFEKYPNLSEARKRENDLKSGIGREELDRLESAHWGMVSR